MARILFYGNCQVEALAKYALLRSDTHKLTVVRNYELIADRSQVAPTRGRLGKQDVVIYQPLGDQHGELATTESGFFRDLGSPTYVCMPYIYNSALWPTFPDGSALHREDELRALLMSKSRNEIQCDYLLGRLDFGYAERLEQTFGRLRASEEGCDIKVADFLEENLVDRKLFRTQNHPTGAVFGHVVEQLAAHLGKALFPTRRQVEDAGENFAELPLEWKVELSSWLHYRFTWVDPHAVLKASAEFLELCDSITGAVNTLEDLSDAHSVLP